MATFVFNVLSKGLIRSVGILSKYDLKSYASGIAAQLLELVYFQVYQCASEDESQGLVLLMKWSSQQFTKINKMPPMPNLCLHNHSYIYLSKMHHDCF